MIPRPREEARPVVIQKQLPRYPGDDFADSAHGMPLHGYLGTAEERCSRKEQDIVHSIVNARRKGLGFDKENRAVRP